MSTTTKQPGPQPTVRVAGKFLVITYPGEGVGIYERDHVVTAYLMLLDHDGERGVAQTVERRLVAEYGLLHLDAVRAVLAAGVLRSYGIEP